MRERRMLLALFCAANLAYLGYDALRFDPLSRWVLVGRGTAELALIATYLVLRRPRAPGWNPLPLLRVTCIAALGGWLLVVQGAGGSSSAYFTMVAAFPLIYAAAFPEDPLGSVLAGAADLAGGFVCLTAEGASLARRFEWLALSVFLTAAAFAGSILARRRILREFVLEKARREAVEQLAASEERRARSERLAVVGQLAAGIAHELNNPLSYVRSNLKWLEKTLGGDASAECREVMGDSLEGVTRMAEIVSDLRSFSREIPEIHEECEPRELMLEALRLVTYRVNRAARVIQEADETLPRIRVPRRRLVQALVNLLLNAADAVERRAGPSSLETRWIRLAARTRGGAVMFVVEDNGPGLDAHVRAHLFEPFFTTKGCNGTGLGLAISRENVERCGGSLEGGAGAEGGARFTILIPAAARGERQAGTAA